MLVQEEIFIVSPFQTLERIFALVKERAFWHTVGMSFLRIISGYALGVVFGVLFAFFMSVSKVLKELISPLIRLAKTVPVASFIILALLWLQKDYVPIFITFLIVLPIVTENVYEAIGQTPKIYLDVARVYKFGFFKTVKTVYFHSILPHFGAAAITALGLSWKSGVAAEVIAKPVLSIGYNLYKSKINIETADLFAWTAVVVALSVLLEKIIKRILLKITKG